VLTDMKAKKVRLEPPRRAATAAEDKLGIDVSRLQEGTRLLIETEMAVYEMKVPVAADGHLIIHAPLDFDFNWPVRLRLRGSIYNLGEIKPSWIGRGCRLKLEGRSTSYFIGPVFSALIILPSGTEFGLWDS